MATADDGDDREARLDAVRLFLDPDLRAAVASSATRHESINPPSLTPSTTID
jgi:hypothetical protein